MSTLSESLFNVVRPDFFRVLASRNSAFYVDALDALERHCAEQPQGLQRDDANRILSSLFASRPLDGGDELLPEGLAAPEERARWILIKLVDSGWIEEVSAGFEKTFRFSSEGAVVLEALRKVARPEAPVYTNKLEAVCDTLLRLDLADRNPWATLETCLANLREGLRELGLLETNIRRLTRKALEGRTLRENLAVFFDRFTAEIGHQSYHKLVRAQLPPRLLQAADRVERLFSDEAMFDKMVAELVAQGGVAAPAAAARIRDALDQLARLLREVEPSVERVEQRTSDFTRRSLSRFRYLQEVGSERRHQVRDLFEWVRTRHAGKRIVDLEELELPHDFPPLRVIHVSLLGGWDSLYAPRQRLEPAEIEPVPDVPDAAALEESHRELAAALRETLGTWRANEFAARLPGAPGTEISLAAMGLRNDDHVLDLIACLLHAESSDARYRLGYGRLTNESWTPEVHAGYAIDPLTLRKR